MYTVPILALSTTDRKVQVWPYQTESKLVSSRWLSPTRHGADSILSPLQFTYALSMEGHMDWVRCLDWSPLPAKTKSDLTSETQEELFLASGSQDAYVRLWSLTSISQAVAAKLEPQQDVEGDGELDDKLFEEFEKRLNGGAGGGEDDDAVGQVSMKSFVVSAKDFDGRSVFGFRLVKAGTAADVWNSVPSQRQEVFAGILRTYAGPRHLGHLAPLLSPFFPSSSSAPLRICRQLAHPLVPSSLVFARGADLVPRAPFRSGLGQGTRFLWCPLGWSARHARGSG